MYERVRGDCLLKMFRTLRLGIIINAFKNILEGTKDFSVNSIRTLCICM